MTVTHKTKSAHRFPAHPRHQTASRPRTGSSSVMLLADDGGQEIAVLSIRGDVDLATAPVLRELLLPVLRRGRGPVVVDLTEVPFMDSTGVHLLVEAHRRLRSQSRRLAIACREHGRVHRLLALVGLLDLLTVHRSRESAVTGGDQLIRSEGGGTGTSAAQACARMHGRSAWRSDAQTL